MNPLFSGIKTLDVLRSKASYDPTKEITVTLEELDEVVDEIKPSLYCDCGRRLSTGVCSICDNDE